MNDDRQPCKKCGDPTAAPNRTHGWCDSSMTTANYLDGIAHSKPRTTQRAEPSLTRSVNYWQTLEALSHAPAHGSILADLTGQERNAATARAADLVRDGYATGNTTTISAHTGKRVKNYTITPAGLDALRSHQRSAA